MTRIAVVLATHDRRDRLAALLESLRAQTVEDFAVVVVDDASEDGTPDLLASAEGLQLHVIRHDTSVGPSVARDDGWRAVDAELIAFTDDDCEVAPDWLERLLAAHAEHPGAILQGATEPIERERGRLGPNARTQIVRKAGPRFQCCNIAYPRAVLEHVDGFDRTYGWGGEDADLAWRAIEAGTPVRWVPSAKVQHAVNLSGPGALLRSAGKFGGAMRLYRRHPQLREEDLVWGLFWKPSHQLLLQALAGAVLSRRHPAALLLAYPYLKHLERRWADAPQWAPLLVAYDILETLHTVRGAVEHRTIVI